MRVVSRNNLQNFDCDIPLGVLTTVTGVSGSGKSSLIAEAVVDLVTESLGQAPSESAVDGDPLEQEDTIVTTTGRIGDGLRGISGLLQVDQKPIGRTPRSNLSYFSSQRLRAVPGLSGRPR